jgi:hypothetical protein
MYKTEFWDILFHLRKYFMKYYVVLNSVYRTPTDHKFTSLDRAISYDSRENAYTGGNA